MKKAEELLASRNVKATANRIIVLDALLSATRPLGLVELETEIETMDRSSIFRALSLFLNADIVHGIEDGSGSLKYEICHGDGHCSIDDMHVHFYCEKCGKTYCLESLHIPQVALPEGFTPHTFNYIIKGHCPSCSYPQ